MYTQNLRHQVDQRRMSPNTRRAYVSINISMSYESAKKARTVISRKFRGLEKFCRHKVEETDRLGRRLGKRGAVWADLPDLAEASLSTGTRLGETLALTGARAELVAGHVDHRPR